MNVFYTSELMLSRLMVYGLMEWTSLTIRAGRISSFMLSAVKWCSQGIHWPLLVPSLSEKEKQMVMAIGP